MQGKQRQAIERLYLRDKHPFSRGLLRLKPHPPIRTLVENMQEIEKYCRLNRDVFLNVFSEDQLQSHEYDCIFLDVDDAWDKMARIKLVSLCATLDEEGIKKYTIFWSGKKGYHVYIKFKTITIQNYRRCILNWIEKIKIGKMIDMSAIEPNRVSRIPYSINSKSEKVVIPLGNDVRKVKGEPKEEESWTFEVNEGLHTVIKACDTVERKASKQSNSQIFGLNRDQYPDCMEALIQDAEAGISLGHTERLEMGKFLMKSTGNNIEEVSKYFALMPDYKENVTKYQLGYLEKRNYKMANCKTMQENGLCPMAKQEDCVFFPSLNRHMK